MKFFVKKLPIIKNILLVVCVFVFNRFATRLFLPLISAQHIVTILGLIYGYFIYWLLKLRGANKGTSLNTGIVAFLISQASLFIVIEVMLFVLLSFYPFKKK